MAKYKTATDLEVTFNDNFEEIRDEFTQAVADESPDRIYSAGIELMQAYTIRIEFLRHSLTDHLEDLSKVMGALRDLTDLSGGEDE